MSKQAKLRLIKYGTTGVVCALMAAGHVFASGFGGLDTMGKYLVLCDAFTIPGLLMIMLGAMMWISSKGGLDAISYIMSYVVSMLIPGKKHLRQNYGDYVAEKSEKRISGYGFFFVVGGVCMALTLVFLMLFYSAYPG